MKKLSHLLATIAFLILASNSFGQSSDFDNNLKFICAGDKCFGLEFSFRYPSTWKFIEPDRPNVVAKVFSENGKGLEGVVVSVFDDPQLFDYSIKDIAFSAMPKGAKLIKFENDIRIDDCNSSFIEFSYDFKKLDMLVYSRNVVYVVRYKKYCLILAFSVGDKTLAKSDIDKRFNSFYPLFKKMALGVTILSKYK
jgi:hypothetical protein